MKFVLTNFAFGCFNELEYQRGAVPVLCTFLAGLSVM